ncbi:hypothetical protein DFQ30_001865 [Apophysomyces sp. BC1015]|nr:hypothetical protein DFQ30_001865 [Apophysomyces sp. BC1015]
MSTLVQRSLYDRQCYGSYYGASRDLARTRFGHRANIFSAKFIPHTSDSVIVSAAGDAEVRVFDVNASSSGVIQDGLRQAYTCHSDRVKRIGLDEQKPHEFLTCSEDGTVRHFDLRRPHKCTPHSIRSFLTASSRPARQYPVPVGNDVREGCPSPLLDYGDYGVEINTLSMNKLHPQYFAVAGMDEYMYLHDRRMTQGGGGGGKNQTLTNASRCIKRFTCSSGQGRRRSNHVTACKFSDANGQELLGSWSSDGIYLFNINDSPTPTPAQNTLKQSSSIKRNLGEVLDRTSEMDLIIRLFKVGDLDRALDEIRDILSDRDKPEDDAENDESQQLRKVWGLCLSAAIQVRRLYERRVHQDSTRDADYFAGEALASARQHMQEAESAVPNVWQGWWCLAVGFWIASGGDRTSGCEDREEWLSKAQSYAEKAKEICHGYTTEDDPFETSPHHSTRMHQKQEASTDPSAALSHVAMMERFIKDIQRTMLREGYSDTEDIDEESGASDGSDESAVEPRWKWIDYMYKQSWMESFSQDTSKHPAESETGPSKRPRHSNLESELDELFTESSQGQTPAGSDSRGSNDEVTQMEAEDEVPTAMVNDASDDTEEEDNDNEEEEEEEEEAVVVVEGGEGPEHEATDNNDVEMQSDSSDDEDEDSDDNSDDDWLPRCRHVDRRNMESGTDIVSPRSRYVGHCNVRTVKDVNFYGLNDEYVVSGSDDGFVFVWDKKTEKIVQILEGDEDTVNVIQGHPKIPVMAVSGIDNTVKIFSPTAGPTRPSSHIDDMNDIIARNQERHRSADGDGYLPRHVLAALSATIRRRQRRQRGGDQDGDDEDDDDDEGGAVECHMQ